jgi:acetyl-CoA synthetase
VNTDDLDGLPIAWRPAPGAFAASPVGRMAAAYGLSSFEEVAARAQAEPEWFWAAAAEDVGLRWLTPYDRVLDLSDGPEFPHFFPGGRLNWADYAVDRWVDEGRGDHEAVWWEGDDGAQRSLSYADLKADVDRAAGAFRAAGLGEGDVVGLLLPMVPEAVVTILAAAKVGAVVAPMFSGYGPGPVRDRLVDSGAKAVVTCDAFPRRGRPVRLKDVLDEAAGGLDALATVFVVRRLGDAGAPTALTSGRDRWWDEALAVATPVPDAVPLSSEAPCLLLYSSGSTGKPKGCVHTHAGMPFKFAAESRYGLGLDRNGRLCWLTDMGWVMGAYLVTAALTNGGTAVLFEGTPDFPEPDRLWDVARRARVTALGIAPTVVRALMAHGEAWPDRHDLADLRAIGSTGEPWNIEPWWWAFRHIGRERVPIVNMSGGTECGASIVSGSIVTPTKPAAFSGPTLGMAADVVDEAGASVRGAVGELVVRRPWPGMTKGFWGGDDRYLDTYWRRFPGAWQQGDFAYVDTDGFWYLLGRSDDTIMLAGKRVGPAEVESVLVDDPDVVEAAAVGVPHEVKGEALVCFVTLRAGALRAASDGGVEAVTDRLVDAVVRSHGKTVRPSAVHVVDALPKTRNGKVMRRLAKAAYLGRPLGDTTALDNPESVAGFPTAPGAGPPPAGTSAGAAPSAVPS